MLARAVARRLVVTRSRLDKRREAHTLAERVKGAYRVYDGLLQTHRLPTTTVTGAVLAIAGDACTQAATQPTYDPTRGVSFGFFGAVVTGPVNFVWLGKLDAIVRRLAPAGGMRAVGWKVAVQSIFFQPLVYVPLFFSFSAAFRGWSFETTCERVRQEYPSTLRSLWGFWTPICVFTFAVLPVRQQAIFFSGISLAWNAILSFLSNRNESVAVETKEAHESVGVAPDRKRLTRTLTAAERLLPTYQPPMGILDNDPQQPRPRPPTDQTIIGYLLGPGLM